MHNVKGAGLTTICLTTVGSEAGNMPTENFSFSSSTVEITAATVASMLILFSSYLLVLFVAASYKSAMVVDTTKKKSELLIFGCTVELVANTSCVFITPRNAQNVNVAIKSGNRKRTLKPLKYN